MSDGADRFERPSRFAIGLFCLSIVVLLWSASGFLTASILQGGEPFDKPFLITWLQTSSFTLCVVNADQADSLSYLIWPAIRHLRGHSPRADKAYERLGSDVALRTKRMSTADTARLAASFCVAWLAANWSMNAALAWTTVSSTVVLSSTSGLFTLVLGRLIGVESLTLAKLFAVFISIVGAALVTNSDSLVDPSVLDDQPAHRLWGDALALLSALLYAVYVLLLKTRARDEDGVDMPLFFGFVGLFNMLGLWPVGVALDALGIETLEWPHGQRLIASLIINSSITFVADYLYAVALLRTTPLTTTLGMSLTIPLSLIGDVAIGTRLGGIQAFAGAILVLASFTTVGYIDAKEADQPVFSAAREEDAEES